MPIPLLVAIIGLAAAALSAGTAFATKWFIDRPHAETAAGISRDAVEQGAEALSLQEVRYWRSLVTPLRAEVADLSQQLTQKTDDCQQNIAALRASYEYTLEAKDREIKALQSQVARLLLRVDSLEQEAVLREKGRAS